MRCIGRYNQLGVLTTKSAEYAGLICCGSSLWLHSEAVRVYLVKRCRSCAASLHTNDGGTVVVQQRFYRRVWIIIAGYEGELQDVGY